MAKVKYTEEQIAAWKQNRKLSPMEVVNELSENLKKLAQYVGKDAGALRAETQLGRINTDLKSAWIWIPFQSEKFDEETRQYLSALGFKPNKERKAWQHPCGNFKPHSPNDPREQYEVANAI